MKKHSLYLLAAGFALLSNVALTSCDEDDVTGANDVLAVKSVLPTKVMEGQVVTITGTGLDKATAVVFPGNVTVTDITKVGNGYITVVAPAGLAADGGSVTVKADNEEAESVMTLSLGKPEPLRVAPLDKEIKINECLEVYGKDLEFITRAYFPGEDGNQIVVNAENFRRKSTGALYIYSPMGIVAGPANVILEDCSGKKYTLPEVTLSDEVAGGVVEAETGMVIWEGPFEVTSWNWFEPSYTDLDLQGFTPLVGQTLRFVISGATDTSRFCYCYGNWGGKDLGGEGDINNIGITSDMKEVTMTIDETMVNDFISGSPIFHVSGTNFVIEKIVIDPVTLWEGEQYIEPDWANWIYFSSSAIPYDFGGIEPAAGMTLRITTAPHEGDITFCLCLGSSWWAPDLSGSGQNTITVPADQNTVEYTLTEEAVDNLKNQIILGGSNWTVTKIELFGAKL